MYSIFPKIRGIVFPTLATCLDRFERLYDELGWVDMKFDPVLGTERSGDFYLRDRVYGWIQGRALESLVAHARWLSKLNGYASIGLAQVNGVSVVHAAAALYQTLSSRCFKGGAITASFIMDPQGKSLSPSYPVGTTTLSHLFCLRGLAAYADFSDFPEHEMAPILAALRRAVDAANAGACIDDQIKFGQRGGESYSVERRGYEGQMIAIGACEILYGITGVQEDLDRGMAAISYVVEHHLHYLPGGLVAMIDAFGPDGEPLLEKGRLATNPGHAIEFAGLAMGFFRKAAARGALAVQPESWIALTKKLSALVVRYHGLCRAPHGGIVRSMDAATGEALEGFCPWWSSFEAARTLAEMYALADTESDRQYCAEAFNSYIETIEVAYLKPSSIGIPVQTISYEGEVLPIIPATPDIDSGYHTGMPLLVAYELFAHGWCNSWSGGLLFGAAEEALPPRLGVRLQGHVARVLPADGVLDSLSVRCLALQTPWVQVLLLSADVLEFSHAWSESIYRAIERRFGVSGDSTLLFASHTHTAPPTLCLGLIDADTEFLVSLEAGIMSVVERALSSLQPGRFNVAVARCTGLGINRRYRDQKTGTMWMKPNPSGPKDEEIPVLWIEDAEGEPQCVVVNPTIHPTTLGVSIHKISADYPGRMAEHLKRAFGPGLVVIPIQGACGDVRPAILDSSGCEFIEGREEDIDRIGTAMAQAVLTAMVSGSKAELPALAVITRNIEFPMATMWSDPSVASATTGSDPIGFAETYAAWARKTLNENYDSEGHYIGPTAIHGKVSLVRLTVGVYLFCLPGEAFCSIGLHLKKQVAPARLIVGGYCGGSMGYMPTEIAFAEGGYEVESAYRFYGYPAALAPSTEGRLYSLLDEMQTCLENENPLY